MKRQTIMKKLTKRIAAMGAAVMMMSTMVISAGAYTVSDSYNELYYSGNETTQNYYVTYSRGTNKTASSRFLIVTSILYSNSGALASNTSDGITVSKGTRSCYANAGSSNVYRSFHRSMIKKSTSYSDSNASTLTRYIYY